MIFRRFSKTPTAIGQASPRGLESSSPTRAPRRRSPHPFWPTRIRPIEGGRPWRTRLLAGLAVPDTGCIRIDGLLAAANGRSLREPEERNVGMVFQDLALWPHLSVWDNLALGLKARRIRKDEREKRIRQFLRLIGLESLFQAKPDQLSGGEQQRVALARALVLEPTLLLMDEPLSGLDDARRGELIRKLLQLHSQMGFTLLYVTHSREEASLIGSRTVYMDEG